MSDTYLPGDTRQRIQDLIKNRKITQAELAEKVGLSNSALSRYLRGRTTNLGDGFIIRIAKYFDVSTDFLLGETDIPDRKNYDIEELRLSAETAKLLYTGKVDASVLNQLIEHPRFPQLLLLLARYRDETMIAGINAMNQILTFIKNRSTIRSNLVAHLMKERRLSQRRDSTKNIKPWIKRLFSIHPWISRIHRSIRLECFLLIIPLSAIKIGVGNIVRQNDSRPLALCLRDCRLHCDVQVCRRSSVFIPLGYRGMIVLILNIF